MPTPREAELYKDKIEVSLDGRQIFYLFFGGAVIVGLVFVLGVMVGRRVEARGHLDHARTAAAVDPLAALDRLEGNGAMSFQTALTGTSATTDVERKIADLEKAHGKGDGKPGAKVEAKASDKQPGDKKVEDKKPEAKQAEAKRAEDKKLEDKKPEAKQAEAPKPDAKPAEDKKVAQAAKGDGDKKAEDKKPEGDKKADDKKVDAKPKKDAEVAAADDAKPKFTLQLSSFQDKNEADAFLSSLKASGYQAYVTEANVSGKGTFYRVRLGTYRSMEAATTAKADFEKASKKTASIMRL